MAPKKIPQSRVIQHFLSLSDQKRFELLSKHLEPDKVRWLSSIVLNDQFTKLKTGPEHELRAFIRQKFGDTEEHLRKTVKHGESLCEGLWEDIYRGYGNRDEDKLCALIKDKTTLPNRIRLFYDDLSEQDQKAYERQALVELNDPKKLGVYLGDRRNFKGQSNQAFMADVLKTMDLSKEPSTMELLRNGIPENDPARTEKLHCAAQQFMIYADGAIDPNTLTEKLKEKGWKKEFNTQKNMKDECAENRLTSRNLMERIKNAVNDVPETEAEKAVFREAGLQTCRDFIAFKEITDDSAKEDPDKAEFLKYYRGLQKDMAAEALKDPSVQEIRDALAQEYETLSKEKSGWFLSKTNSKEYDEMMKGLRIFNAKLDMMNGKQPSKDLTQEELQTAENTEPDVLLANAKQGLYKYGSLKTKNGTGSIWHGAGTERFNSSMKSLQKLGELGKKLHLSNTATALRDETQLAVLQHRGDSKWLKENIADAFAKSMCAQVSLNKRVPEYRQRTGLEGAALQKKVEKIKADEAFQKMMKTTSPEKLADAIIKGGSSLYNAYNKAAAAAQKEGYQPADAKIKPELLQPKNDTSGLVAGK